jgi:hypothetical protein
MVTALTCLSLYGLIGSGQDTPGAPRSSNPAAIDKPSTIWKTLMREAKRGPGPESTRRRLHRNFAFLYGPPEPMPQSTAAHIRATVGAPHNVDFSDAQHLQTRSGGIWIVHSADGITCVMFEADRRSLACSATAAFAVRGLAIGTAQAPRGDGGHSRHFHVLGLVPSWVKVVQVRRGLQKELRNVPVKENVYMTPMARLPVFVERLCKSVDRGCRRI